jgi:hypothetical protein
LDFVADKILDLEMTTKPVCKQCGGPLNLWRREKNFCFADCREAYRLEMACAPLTAQEIVIMVKMKRDGASRKILHKEFGVSFDYLAKLCRRAEKTLTDTQFRELYEG